MRREIVEQLENEIRLLKKRMEEFEAFQIRVIKKEYEANHPPKFSHGDIVVLKDNKYDYEMEVINSWLFYDNKILKYMYNLYRTSDEKIITLKEDILKNATTNRKNKNRNS